MKHQTSAQRKTRKPAPVAIPAALQHLMTLVAKDARREPELYLRETRVPGGGE